LSSATFLAGLTGRNDCSVAPGCADESMSRETLCLYQFGKARRRLRAHRPVRSSAPTAFCRVPGFSRTISKSAPALRQRAEFETARPALSSFHADTSLILASTRVPRGRLIKAFKE
jgi:hypothetical protein